MRGAFARTRRALRRENRGACVAALGAAVRPALAARTGASPTRRTGPTALGSVAPATPDFFALCSFTLLRSEIWKREITSACMLTGTSRCLALHQTRGGSFMTFAPD